MIASCCIDTLLRIFSAEAVCAGNKSSYQVQSGSAMCNLTESMHYTGCQEQLANDAQAQQQAATS